LLDFPPHSKQGCAKWRLPLPHIPTTKFFAKFFKASKQQKVPQHHKAEMSGKNKVE
jgi:hypothetical protein